VGLTKRIIIAQAFLFSLGLSTMGCQQGYQERTVVGADQMSLDDNSPENELPTKVNQVSVVAELTETALSDATFQIDSLVDSSGSLGLSFSSSNVGAQSALDVLKKLQEAFDKVLAFLNQVTEKLDEVRAKLDEAKEWLDPTNPAHAKLIEKLDKMIARLELIEDRIDALLGQIVQRVDTVVSSLDQYKAKLNPLNPVHVVVLVYVDQVRGKLIEFRQKIADVIAN
jgi:chromosome segregation ATPase